MLIRKSRVDLDIESLISNCFRVWYELVKIMLYIPTLLCRALPCTEHREEIGMYNERGGEALVLNNTTD